MLTIDEIRALAENNTPAGKQLLMVKARSIAETAIALSEYAEKVNKTLRWIVEEQQAMHPKAVRLATQLLEVYEALNPTSEAAND